MPLQDSSSTASDTATASIGPNDVISVQGQYLYKRDGTRFFIKGIAFPVSVVEPYNATAWIAILHQLKSLDLEYNTVRIYDMDPTTDYSEFLEAAASLGVYVIVPLTGRGGGILDRGKAAPHCYTRQLFDYGRAGLENYVHHPNVLAGLLANEVMNSPDSWKAAPCVKAYGRDLKRYLKLRNYRPLPLIYAAQHSGIGAHAGDVGTMWLTLNYLTCSSDSNRESSTAVNRLSSSVDIMGVNVESWCSSQGSFVFNEDGSAGSYYSLWLGLHQSTVPLVFTEMGCSHVQFDKDNGLATPQGTRDWKQVPVVLHDMSDTWSGFCAYAYYGNPMFSMFQGGPWRLEPLEPTDDFYNFRDALKLSGDITAGRMKKDPPMDYERFFTPSCKQVQEELQDCCDIELYEYMDIPSYALDLEGATLPQADGPSRTGSNGLEGRSMLIMGLLGFVLVGMLLRKGWRTMFRRDTYQTIA